MAKSNEHLSELLSAYIDGEVTPREKAEVDEILRRDPAAKKLHDELRQAVAAIAGLPRHAAPPDMASFLDAQLERVQLLSGMGEIHGKVTVPAPSRFTWLKAAAMLLIVVGAGWWFLSLQQPRNQKVASKETGPPTLTDTASVGAKPILPQPTEVLLAGGASPTALISQSFEHEPVRVQVTARSEGEREEIKKKISTQLAQANAVNLATQPRSISGEKQVGAFYLEGKPGVNFSNASERQILVRLPQSQADQIIDSVTAGGKVPGDQVALHVGPATVRGSEKARTMLQMMASKDESKVVDSAPTSVVDESRESGKPEGLLKTLTDMVGVTPATRESARSARDRSLETDPFGPVPASDPLADAKVESVAKRDSDVDPTRPLVLRRMETARTNKSAEEFGAAANVPAEVIPTPPAASFNASANQPTDPYITIVIELALPESKPPARSIPGRMRS